MQYIERDNSETVDFTFSISGNELIITPNVRYNGTYYLFLTGTDLIAGLRLMSTDGEFLTETFLLSFTVSDAEQPGEIVDLIDVNIDTADISVDYTTILFSGAFSQIFSENILEPFNQRMVVEPFDGEETTTQLLVTNTSTPLICNGNVVTGIINQPANALVYINMDNIKFQSGRSKSFEFVCVTQLKPYINFEYIRKQFGTYKQNITTENLYFAQLQQMIKFEDAFGKQIIGVSTLTPREKMFLQQQQHLELLKSLMLTKQLVANDSISINNVKIQYGNSSYTLDYIKQMENNFISSYQDLRPSVAERGINHVNTRVHQRALKALDVLFRYLTKGGSLEYAVPNY